MNQHHMWCSKFGDITEGVCMLCERLNRLYPATGDPDYPVTYEAAMEIYPDTNEHHEKAAAAKRNKNSA